ncbi:hypothetical protein L9F63_004217, partial [Diploptera punctata]
LLLRTCSTVLPSLHHYPPPKIPFVSLTPVAKCKGLKCWCLLNAFRRSLLISLYVCAIYVQLSKCMYNKVYASRPRTLFYLLVKGVNVQAWELQCGSKLTFRGGTGFDTLLYEFMKTLRIEPGSPEWKWKYGSLRSWHHVGRPRTIRTVAMCYIPGLLLKFVRNFFNHSVYLFIYLFIYLFMYLYFRFHQCFTNIFSGVFPNMLISPYSRLL